ncbi:MAG: cupin domain-containing protein [Parachlamydiaceae bacterium]|nr:cupin domain-containing protein [Parachlamydiaceae bacterium]
MPDSHHFHLNKTAPQQLYEDGSRIDINQKVFSKLSGMAISYLTLKARGMREPHWHPNANELGYCLEGRALMTIFSPGAAHDTFIIEPGTLSFVPKGYLHHLQNLGNTPLKMLLCFNHEMPEDLNLSSTLEMIPPSALGSTFSLDPEFFKKLQPSLKPVFISKFTQDVSLEPAWQNNRFKMNLKGIQPQIKNKGGSVSLNNQSLMPTLEGLTMYSLELEPKGVREPHWHPNAHELNYLINGRARIALLSPGEKIDSFEMEAGDISFLPKGYYHYIENIGDIPLQFAIFFNHSMPSDLGLSGALGAYSNELLASIFKVDPSYFSPLPKYQEDLFVVAGGG